MKKILLLLAVVLVAVGLWMSRPGRGLCPGRHGVFPICGGGPGCGAAISKLTQSNPAAPSFRVRWFFKQFCVICISILDIIII